ncbi:hypothetical protein LPJ66_011458, partial [Kickxella alabastrina]
MLTATVQDMAMLMKLTHQRIKELSSAPAPASASALVPTPAVDVQIVDLSQASADALVDMTALAVPAVNAPVAGPIMPETVQPSTSSIMAPSVSDTVLDSKAGILMDVDSDNGPLVQSLQTIQLGIDSILLAMTLTQTVDEGAMDLDRDSALEAELMTVLSEIYNQLANALHGSVQGNVGAHLLTSRILDSTHIGTGKQGPLGSLYSGSTIHQLLLELNIELQTTFGSMQLTVKPSQPGFSSPVTRT